MLKWITMFLLACSFSAAAATPQWASAFTGKLNAAALGCSLSAQLAAQARAQSMVVTGMTRSTSNTWQEYDDKYMAKCAAAQETGKQAFDAALESPDADPAQVRNVYAAWMTYMDAISPADAAEYSPAKTAYQLAVNQLYASTQ